MLTLEKADQSKKKVLWNLLQKYLYEFSVYYRDQVDEDGNYAYPYFDLFFEEPGREAYLIREGESIAGFLMLNRHSETGEEIDFAVAEFCILPVYRRGHRGEEAMRRILETHRGCWEIKYNQGNPPAERFWDRVTAPYKRRITSLADGDRVISFRNDS